MKINVLEVIKNYEGEDMVMTGDDGKTLLDEKGNEKKVNLRHIFSTALNTILPEDKPQTAEAKHKIFQLSNKLYQHKEVNFTVNEAALIKEKVGKVYNALVYGRVVEVLEGKDIETN